MGSGKFEHIKGLIAAPLTPFKEDGEINYEIIPQYCEMLYKNGVAGVFVNGTTGEGLSLTLEERKKTAEKWVDSAPSDFKVLIHIGNLSIKNTQRLAKHAAEIGAFGVGSLPSLYFKPGTVEELARNIKKEASFCSELPYYYYHIPSLSGVNFPMFDLLKAIEDIEGGVPNFAGIKYTFETLMDYNMCLNYKNGKYNMLFGRDEMFLPALTMGAQGAIGSTYNFIPSIYIRILERFRSNQLHSARELQEKSILFIKILLETSNFFSGCRAIMEHVGLEVGRIRHPLRDIPSKTKDTLIKKIVENDLEKYLIKI
ncbi:MAG: dihydrodipicolinate synthase family protein [Promethearchaeota archaeon]